MQQTIKTKKGAAAIYTVVFFCLLIGIVTLGFISIMLQDILGSTNYDLSQSAYDSALAGVEDAKVLLLKYNACISNSERLATADSESDVQPADCKTIVDNINAAGSSDDCDLIRKSLGRAYNEDGANETLIQSQNSSLNNSSKELADSIDMAYTCVKMSLSAPDYLGTLTETSDVKLIPLRTGVDGSGAATRIAQIRIRWYNIEDSRAAETASYELSLPSSKFGMSGKTPMGDDAADDWHNFQAKATLPPPIRVSLIQADETFSINDFDGPNGNNANRGTLILRPVNGSGDNYVPSNAGSGFTGSTISSSTNYTDNNIKATNSPVDVFCHDNATLQTSGEEYACEARLDIPKTIGESVNNGTRFLILSSLYAKPNTSFSIELYDESGSKIDFVGVQTPVDATGRANDLFRRVEARVELQDVSFPLAKYGLNVYGDGDGEGSIFKNYWATINCWYKENGTSSTCDDYTRIDDRGSFGG